MRRLKAGPDRIYAIMTNGTNYTDKLFTGKDMVWWEGDTLTTPSYSTYKSYVDKGTFYFRDWTTFLKSTTDLFYANGTISFSQIN